jgi:hypothetical protein
MGGVFDFGQARGLASAFGSVGLALAVAGGGFLVASWVLNARGARLSDGASRIEG